MTIVDSYSPFDYAFVAVDVFDSSTGFCSSWLFHSKEKTYLKTDWRPRTDLADSPDTSSVD